MKFNYVFTSKRMRTHKTKSQDVIELTRPRHRTSRANAA